MGCRVSKRRIQHMKAFWLKIDIPKGKNILFYELTYVVVSRQKVQESDFQSQFPMSKLMRIFLFFFIEKYLFRSTFFVNHIKE